MKQNNEKPIEDIVFQTLCRVCKENKIYSYLICSISLNNYILSNQCVYLHCSVDVLMSYKADILNSVCLISRAENDYNDNIVDTLAPITENTVYTVKNFGENIKTTEHFIIGVI